MSLSQKQEQEWHYKQKGAFASPRPDISSTINGETFSRTLGKRCPWCSDVFYTYQIEGKEKQPYQVDANPRLGYPDGFSFDGIGVRETCGHPKCWEAEDKYQYERRLQWRKSNQRKSADAPAPKDGGKIRD